jgi:hypothetical protein
MIQASSWVHELQKKPSGRSVGAVVHSGCMWFTWCGVLQLRHPSRHDEVGWMLHPILGRIPTDFFRQGLPRAAFNEAPMVDHAEPPVLPTAADHGADGAQVRRGASKALARSVECSQPGTAACSACMYAQACEAAPTSGRRVRDRGGGGAWFGSAHSSQRHGRRSSSGKSSAARTAGGTGNHSTRSSAACTSWAAVCVGRRIKAATAIACPQA